MGDLAPLLTAGGGLGAFVAVIIYLLSANRLDRREYQEAIDKAEDRADEAKKRERDAQVELDQARARARSAEDERDHARRELARCRAELGRPP